MTWKWDQSAGQLSRNGEVIATGYSGRGRGKNSPSMQAAVGVGPIPAGKWAITERYDSANVGPYALRLVPKAETQTFGRSEFRIHGDSIRSPGNASHGCIILPRPIRQRIWTSGDHDLEVVE